MAITAYVGLPGHGKSYGAVANVIIPALRQKRLVYTNIPMYEDHCLNELGMVPVPFSIDDLIKNPNWFRDVFTSGAILVLDECWKLWPSGLKANAVREGDKTFLAEHRHMVGENGYSTEVYLVVQDLANIAMFARSLVETTVRMVKLVNLGFDKRFRVDFYSGAVTGPKPPVSKREREIHGGKFKKEIYDFYKSHTLSETGFAGDETRTDKRFNILGGLSIKLGLIFIVIVSVYIYFGVDEVKKGYGQDEKIHAKTIDNKTASPSSGSVPAKAGLQNQPVSNAVVGHTSHNDLPRFLSAAKRLLVAYTLGTGDTNKDYYVVEFSDYSVTLDTQQLQKLGYKLDKISDCVVKVIGVDYAGFFMCPKKKEPSTGFSSELAEQAGKAASEVM